MDRKHGPWTIRSTIRRYRNEHIDVVEAEVSQPDGEPGQYATVRMNAGVAVLPIGGDEMVFLTRQFRYAIGRDSVEVAAGAIDAGETPEEAARREAREELGVEGSDWMTLGSIDLDTSIVQAPVQLFLVRGLTFTQPHHEGSETIRIVRIPFREAVEMVMDGRITQAASCILILKADRLSRTADLR